MQTPSIQSFTTIFRVIDFWREIANDPGEAPINRQRAAAELTAIAREVRRSRDSHLGKRRVA